MDARTQRLLRREAYKDSAEWKPKPKLTKAERRAKQEAQRAAKAAAEAEAKAKAKAEAEAKAKAKAKEEAEAKAKKEREKKRREEGKRRKKTLKQELSNATKNEKALYKLLTPIYVEALGTYWWDFDRESSCFWYYGMENEVLWKNTKQLLKNGFGLPEKVKKYYTKYAVVREFLENWYKNRQNPLFKYEVMENVKRTLEKMDEFQKKLDELCPKKCNLYYKSGDDYYNVLMTDVENYQQHWLADVAGLDPYYHRHCCVKKKNGCWDWKPGYTECTPILNWLSEPDYPAHYEEEEEYDE